MREYERTSTTVINAYVRPVVERYLRSLLRRLEAIGVRAPVLLMQSNGGILPSRTAMAVPVQIVESGPAAGVVGARLLARGGRDRRMSITFDMGGTTAKASLIEHGQVRGHHRVRGRRPGLSGQGLNLAGGGYAMKVPVIDISEVGAGGGSIVAVDAGGGLQVGPRSAGAVPGPAAYGLGGDGGDGDRRQRRPRLSQPGRSGRAARSGIDAELAERAIAEQVARAARDRACSKPPGRRTPSPTPA